MVVILIVSGGLALLLCGLAAARWYAARAVEHGLSSGADDERDLSRRGGLQLPQGHRPPPGLSPLSPSERFLTAEVSRGLRDLEMFLLDA